MKLLLSTSLMLLAFLGPCQQKKVAPEAIQDINSDSTVPYENSSSESTAVKPNPDSIPSVSQTTEIIHNAPNQAYIDSVKAAKRSKKFN